MKVIAYSLYGIGILFVLVGIIYGSIKVSEVREDKVFVDFWRDKFMENFDNELIENEYLKVKSEYETRLVFSIAIIVSGIITGVFYIALGAIISLLNKIANKQFVIPQITQTNSPTTSI